MLKCLIWSQLFRFIDWFKIRSHLSTGHFFSICLKHRTSSQELKTAWWQQYHCAHLMKFNNIAPSPFVFTFRNSYFDFFLFKTNFWLFKLFERFKGRIKMSAVLFSSQLLPTNVLGGPSVGFFRPAPDANSRYARSIENLRNGLPLFAVFNVVGIDCYDRQRTILAGTSSFEKR